MTEDNSDGDAGKTFVLDPAEDVFAAAERFGARLHGEGGFDLALDLMDGNTVTGPVLAKTDAVALVGATFVRRDAVVSAVVSRM